MAEPYPQPLLQGEAKRLELLRRELCEQLENASDVGNWEAAGMFHERIERLQDPQLALPRPRIE